MTDYRYPEPRSTGPRVGTIVWGVILVLLGLGVVGVGLGVVIDLQVALIALLALAGAGLLVKAIVGRED